MLAKRSAKSRKPELAAFCKVGSALKADHGLFMMQRNMNILAVIRVS
jgi:hypothetical protein